MFVYSARNFAGVIPRLSIFAREIQQNNICRMSAWTRKPTLSGMERLDSPGGGAVTSGLEGEAQVGQPLDITVLGLNSGTSMVRMIRYIRLYARRLTSRARMALTAPFAGSGSKGPPTRFISSSSDTERPRWSRQSRSVS
jgi:hypothetical protein